MRLAINYSMPSLRLLKEERIRIDVFKCPPWAETVAEARAVWPAYVHFSMRAGNGYDGTMMQEVVDLLPASDTPHVNMHLSPHPSRFKDIPLETRDPAHAEPLVAAMLDDVRCFSDRFGRENIVLENHPWSSDPKHLVLPPAIEPSVISRVVRESGCNFLLDIAHARISSHYLGMDPREYMSALPVDRLRELHVSGVTTLADGSWSDHYAMQDADWAMVEWVVDRIRSGEWPCPWAMVFEYGGLGDIFAHRSDPAVIAEQAPRLFALTRSADASSR